jgi:UDP-N-acetylglucosamine--N-acetylmuramyl-(pentapeptide) pyrophosphoryl-undecaprenol N-acetylglucosamine transferase
VMREDTLSVDRLSALLKSLAEDPAGLATMAAAAKAVARPDAADRLADFVEKTAA